MPKLPPPPRKAQNKSGFSVALARTSLPSGRDHVGRDQVVDGQSELACGPAHAAAEREAGDPGRRIDAERGGEPELLRLLVEVRERGAGLDARCAGRRIDAHRPHQGQVDEETAIADHIAGDVVAASAHRHQELLVACERDCVDDVGGTQAAHHQPRTSVDHRVPDRAGGVVAILAGERDGAAHLAAQGRYDVLRDLLSRSLECPDGQVCHVALWKWVRGAMPLCRSTSCRHAPATVACRQGADV
jgi:hypothetical protein